jgi:undecaprenyl diphosphate synthase
MVPRHLAVIPDGSRRWARTQGLSIEEAYRAGACKALEVVRWCSDAGVEHLSAFGSSRENIEHRRREEIAAIHAAIGRFCTEVQAIPGVALRVFGGPRRAPRLRG